MAPSTIKILSLKGIDTTADSAYSLPAGLEVPQSETSVSQEIQKQLTNENFPRNAANVNRDISDITTVSAHFVDLSKYSKEYFFWGTMSEDLLNKYLNRSLWLFRFSWPYFPGYKGSAPRPEERGAHMELIRYLKPKWVDFGGFLGGGTSRHD